MAIVVPAVITFLVLAALGFAVCGRRKSYQSLDRQSELFHTFFIIYFILFSRYIWSAFADSWWILK